MGLFRRATTTPAASPPRQPRLWITYVVSVTLIATLVISLAFLTVMLEKQRYRERAATATQNIARLLDTHISDVLDNVDSDLKAAILFYNNEASRGPIDSARLNAFIGQLDDQQYSFESLRILDKDGYLRYGKGIPLNPPLRLNDRPYYLQARDTPRAEPIFFGPVRSRISDKWIVVMARRLNAADGSFAGVVYASLATEQFERTFSSIQLGAHGAATLRTADMALVHRVPTTTNAIGTKNVSKQLTQVISEHPDAGEYQAATALDGIERSNAYRKLQRYPFYVIVGLATNDYLGGWQVNAIVISVLAGLTVLLTGYAGYRTYRTQKSTASSLQRERDLKASIVESSEDAIIAQSVDGTVTSWNTGAQTIYGYSPQEMIGRSMLTLFPSDQLDAYQLLQKRINQGDSVQNLESIQLRKDGERIFISSTISALRNERGEVVGQSIIARDITLRKADETRLRLAASVFTHAHEGIVIVDVNACIVDVNSMYEQITGYSRHELLGKNPRISKSGRQSREFYEVMWRSLTEQGHWDGEVWNRRKNGEIYPALLTLSAVRNTQGEIQQYLGILSDITQIKDYQQHLEHVAQHDALTGLPNRLLLADRLSQAIAQVERHGKSIAVVYLDLDGFKEVNDTHGHDVGDELLIAVAQRMKDTLREGDTVARLGGDEFVCLLIDFDGQAECERAISRLLQVIHDPIQLGRLQLQVSASLGVAIYPTDAWDADQLMRCADQAMYQAKQSGKNRIQWFQQSAKARLSDTSS